MANLAGVVQQLRKERDQAARTVEQLDAALAALNGVSYGKGQELGARFQRQDGRGSRLPRERVGRRYAGQASRSRTLSPCPRRRRCQLPPGGRLQQPNERDGRK